MEREECGAWLRLQLTPGVGNVAARRLLAAFGSPQAIFEQTLTTLTQVVPATLAHALLRPEATVAQQAAVTAAWLSSGPDRHLLVLGDPAYPAEWLQMEDPPVLLYAHGQLAALAASLPRVAVVGSRNPSPQGLINARALSRGLGQAGVCVVSGLALGVDGAAHEGALEVGALTVAVVGTGLDRVYPRQHQSLAHRIVEQGVLISEYPLGTPPLAPNFPKRNRLIAALAQGTLVVEAALKSGSLITARMAVDMGREVFAVPGSIHSPQARGCHWLIRQGAKLVESAQDVLDELRGPFGAVPAGFAAPVSATAADDPHQGPHAALLAALGHDPVSLDAVQARTGLGTAALQAALLELELSGEVGRLPGGLFQRLGHA